MKTTYFGLISIILMLSLFISFFPCAAFTGTGGIISTSTSVTATGVANGTVSVSYDAVRGGLPERVEWGSQYNATNPGTQVWSSHLNAGRSGSGFRVSFERQGPGQSVRWTRIFGGI